MASSPSSPTLCRPQHIDRERIRAALRAAAAAAHTGTTAADATDAAIDDGVLFHEAVVVVAAPPRRPRAIQLLALTRDAVLLLPLSSAISGCAITTLPLEWVERFERVTAVDVARRSLLLVPDGELYCLSVRDSIDTRRSGGGAGGGGEKATDFWISSFEPETRVFVHVARACRVHFQRRLLRLGHSHDEVDACEGDASLTLELSDRLETLLGDLMELLPAFDGHDRSDGQYRQSAQLLLELAAAASCDPPLQRLVLVNKTRLAATWTWSSSSSRHNGSETRRGDDVVVGLPALLIQILKAVAASASGDETTAIISEGRLELTGSVVRALGAVLFDSHWLRPERDVFLRSVRLSELIRELQGAMLACYKSSRAQGRGETWHVLWEELLDAHAALLLELDDVLACESEQEQPPPEPSASVGVAAMLVETVGFWRWLEKLVKRICVSAASVERYASELPREESDCEEDGEGDGGDQADQADGDDQSTETRRRSALLWSLTLWRNVALLDLLVAHSRDAILAHLRDCRRDYINFYLRSARFQAAMRNMRARHVTDAARRLEGLIAAIDSTA